MAMFRVGLALASFLAQAWGLCPIPCEDNERCSPQGRCVSACNPPCQPGQNCSDDSQCLLDSPDPVAQIVSTPKHSGPKFWLHVGGGGGYTIVDLAEATGESDNNINDWDQGHYSFSARGMFSLSPRFRLGAEAGYEQLYYAYVVVPYGATNIYREYNAGTTFLGALGQLFLAGPLYLVGGVDLHIFDDGVAPGVSSGLGLQIRLGKVAIPLEFRAKPVFGDGVPVVLQVNAGLAFGLGGF